MRICFWIFGVAAAVAAMVGVRWWYYLALAMGFAGCLVASPAADFYKTAPKRVQIVISATGVALGVALIALYVVTGLVQPVFPGPSPLYWPVVIFILGWPLAIVLLSVAEIRRIVRGSVGRD